MLSIAAPRDRRWLALPVVFSATFMGILDVFIVNVTAPSLRHDLGASVQWVVDGYAGVAIGVVASGATRPPRSSPASRSCASGPESSFRR